MGQKVFKAVIPAAGKGMRMRPFSLVLPKEMMPVGRKTMIQLAIEEASSAGIQEICVVIRKRKDIIKKYLLTSELRSFDRFSGTRLSSDKLTFVYQKSWDGLGGALRVAKSFVGQDPFLMIIPDQLLVTPRLSASQQLLSQYNFERPVVLSSIVRIPKRDASYFASSRGVVADTDIRRTPCHILRIQSEAQTRRSFSSLPYEIRGFGRTVFPPAIFRYFSRKYCNRKTGEIDLWKTFKEFPRKIPHFGCLLQGRACDLGTIEGYYRYLPLFVR